ncbi:helix-turn-helix domain-containing protein [Bradyrhizobium sp. HKCCYLR20261]|uniref:helix-turn-helix domain-containing protein n=1 Tax=Bradyrhizobium sp. HKCCYLR20261 TaxID=3420760 RepID=UPI003EBB2DDF
MAQNADILAANVKRLRRERKFSQEGLAAAADLRQAVVSEIERAEANPTLASLTKLANALDVRLAELFDPRGIRSAG